MIYLPLSLRFVFDIPQMLPYDGFGLIAFHEDTTSVKLVDDCGNM
jgi:hypothetical protein